MAAPVLARVAAALLTNEDGRKTIGWVLALLLSPLILLVVFLCCFGDGASQHNNAVVSAAFYPQGGWLASLALVRCKPCPGG